MGTESQLTGKYKAKKACSKTFKGGTFTITPGCA